jgi:cell fate regulator YaaT (PSP1 superfamily)
MPGVDGWLDVGERCGMADGTKLRSAATPELGDRNFSLSSCKPDAQLESGAEKTYNTCAVRYGHMGYMGEFRYPAGALSGCGSRVVIQTSRGIEIGERVSLTCSGCPNSISRQQMNEYVKNSSAPEFFQPKAGRILREATPQDLLEDSKIKTDAREKLQRARDLARQFDLQMKLIACEHLLGGERIIFHFMSDDRVDFRDMVRELAHEYHTRIEMHQVGARDEARLVADHEICGRECCCRNFLKKLRPVTMRMAKLQKATLDPSKVSGRCGRLRCCLRYEYEGYDELNKKLPRAGARIRTERGIGTVKDRQILTQLLIVVYDDRDQEETIGVEEIIERNLPKRPLPAVAAGTDRPPGQRAESRPTGRRTPAENKVEEDLHEGEADSSENDLESEETLGEDSTEDRQTDGSADEPTGGGSEEQQQQRRSRRRGRRGRRKYRRPNGDGPGGDASAQPPGGAPRPSGGGQ